MKTKNLISVIILCFIGAMLSKASSMDIADNYLFNTMALPLTRDIVKNGEFTLSIKKDFFDKEKKEREIIFNLSPSDTEVVYIVKDNIIISVKIKIKTNVLYEGYLEKERSTIFPITTDGNWANPICAPITEMLKSNIVNFIDKLQLQSGGSVKIKISDISNGNVFAYELFINNDTSMKAFVNNSGFTINHFFSQAEQISIVFNQGNIQYVNYSNNHAIETNINKKTIVVMTGLNSATIYSYTGTIIDKPKFNLQIVK